MRVKAQQAFIKFHALKSKSFGRFNQIVTKSPSIPLGNIVQLVSSIPQLLLFCKTRSMDSPVIIGKCRNCG